LLLCLLLFFFFSSRRRHTRFSRDWSSDVCSSDLTVVVFYSMNFHGICPHSPTTVFVEAESIKSTPYMSFSSLGLSEQLVRATSDQGYETPSPIQLQAIPAVLSGRDVMAAAQTGTGKT